MIEPVGLRSAPHPKASGSALGRRQCRRIAAAMHDPPVVIVGEPFNGTDSEAIILTRDLLRPMAAEGRAILMSSHLMGELQDLADDIVVGGRGRVLADASADEGLARTRGAADAAQALQQAGCTSKRLNGETLIVSRLSAQPILEALSQAQVALCTLTASEATLKGVYVQLTSDEAECRPAPSEDRP